MPTKTAPVTVMTDEERKDIAQKKAAKREKMVTNSNAYPCKYVRECYNKQLMKLLEVENDERPFFVATKKTRICVVPEEYLLPLVPDSECDRSLLHNESFKIKRESISEEIMDLLGEDNLKVLESLGRVRKLEIESGLPTMAAGENFTKKRPVVNTSADSADFDAIDTLLRYVPSLVANEKGIHFHGEHDALCRRLLFGCGAEADIPEFGTAEAMQFWKLNVEKKLFLHANQPVAMHAVDGMPKSVSTGNDVSVYAIFYTICMPGVKHTVDHFTCQGKRVLQQADIRLVKSWIDLTNRLVGESFVPLVAKNYLESKKLNFEEVVLAKMVETVQTETWPSLRDVETEGVNDKGNSIYEINYHEAVELITPFKTMAFVNPSVALLRADGTTKTRVIFNSSEPDKAMLGEMQTRADYRDADEYHSDSFNANLAKIAGVFKSLSYLLAGKQQPAAVVLHDSEKATAKSTGKRKKTVSKAEAAAVAAAATAVECSQIADTLDTFMVEQRKHNAFVVAGMNETVAFMVEQRKHNALVMAHLEETARVEEKFSVERVKNKRFRKFVFANMPEINNDQDDGEQDEAEE